MAEYVAFGDAEAAVIDIVSASAHVVPFEPVVAPDLIGFASGTNWVRVIRSGGVPTVWMRLDQPRISIDVFASTKATAHDLAQAVRGTVFAARGAYTGHGLLLCDVRDALGMAWLPDPDEPLIARYAFALDLTTRPA